MSFDDELDEVIGEFLAESNESLDQLDQAFVALERDPSDAETLAGVFRTMHTIKGTSGFLGFSHLESLTHAAEELLSALRDGALRLTQESTTALLDTGDAVRSMLACVERDGTDGTDDFAALTTRLRSLFEAPAEPPAEPETEAAGAPTPLGELVVESGWASPADVESAVAAQEAGDPRHLGEILVERGVIEPGTVVDALRAQQHSEGGTAPSGGEAHAVASASTIRVDVGLLDRLMNLAGELVLARNQILQSGQSEAARAASTQRLNLITTELQEGIMKTRMQPIDTVWAKFPRIVRDLSVTCGKQVVLEMVGRETELDKTIIEAIKDPLTHLVRNAVDHGIEAATERVARGKPADGCLVLRAYHEGGQVNIEIADDGSGLDLDKIRERAVSRGLVRSDAAAQMSQRDLADLVFLPGFSTADAVTNVSGRGVGMDVVRTNIEAIGGSVDVESEPGAGTTWRIKIPLTLAIIPALIVSTGGERYAIPQAAVVELLRVEEGKGGIEWVHDAPVYRRRGALLPLVFLDRQLALPQRDRAAGANICVLQVNGGHFGLVVDGIFDTEEIVVKPLNRHLKNLAVFAGSTIMGDGRVALILDVAGLAADAAVAAVSTGTVNLASVERIGHATSGERQSLLVLGVGAARRVAIPLSTVARLEEILPTEVELSADGEVVQYRGALLPLVHLADLIGERRTAVADAATLKVVVYWTADGQAGLVVDAILDIVDDAVAVEPVSGVRGVNGTGVIDGKVTDILDTAALTGGDRRRSVRAVA